MRLSKVMTNLERTSCESEVMEIGGLALGIQVLGTVLVLHNTSRLHWIGRTGVEKLGEWLGVSACETYNSTWDSIKYKKEPGLESFDQTR